MEKKTKNQPVYKKAWFWIVIVVLLVIVPVAISSTSQNKNDATTGDSSTVVPQQTEQKTQEKTDYNVGETFSADGVDYTVTSVERNYSTGNMYIKPSDGKEFVKVNVSVKNSSNDKKTYNSIFWKIEDSNGDITSTSIMAQADDALNSGELAAGGQKQSSLVFEIPVGSSAKIHFQPNVFSSKDIIVNL